MDLSHIMPLDQHYNLEEQCSSKQPKEAGMASTSGSISVGVSQVAFVLAAIASLSLIPSSLAIASSLPLGAALSARELLAALCGLVATKKALFVLCNVIFLFLAADCRCFSGICSLSPSANDAVDDGLTASESLPCAVPQPSEDVAVSSLRPPEAKSVPLETAVVVEESACSEAAQQELEKLEIDELNRKFEEFIQSRRIKWQQEEALPLQCQTANAKASSSN